MRRLAGIAVCAWAVVGAFAFEWPLAEPQILRGFAERQADHLLSGIVLLSQSPQVRPIAQGELIFQYRQDSDYSSLPRGVGDFLVLEHSGNMRSLYGHLRSEEMPALPEEPRQGRDAFHYELNQVMGLTGATGAATGQQLFLSIMDTEASSMLNPLLVLPPLADTQLPAIRAVSLINGQTEVSLTPGLRVPAGRYDVAVDAHDLRGGVAFAAPFAPYRIELFLNGVQQSRITFDGLATRQGQRVLTSHGASGTGVPLERLYAGALIVAGNANLAAGEVRVLVLVADYAGNEATMSRSLGVLE